MKDNNLSSIKVEIGHGNTFIDINAKEQHQEITLDMLREIWNDISDCERQDIEYINADVYGKFIVFCTTISQGQGGIVFIWDTDKQKIVHYSDGRFAVKATIHDKKVYVLREVSYCGVTTHLELDYCDFGTMSEENDVISIKLDKSISSNLTNEPANYIIDFDDDSPVIKIKDV